jgi:hypothetical protein
MYIDGEAEESVHNEITGVRKLPTSATPVRKKKVAEVVSIQ